MSSPYQNLFNVHDKVAIVTGGMGQIGREYVKVLSSCGARVAVLDKNIHQGKNEWTNSSEVQTFEVNICQRDSIETALKKIIDIWGVPDILINNAGMDAPPHASNEENCAFENYSESSWDQVMDVNLKGAFLCAQVVGKEMARCQRGSIINISSTYGNVSPDQRIYSYRNPSFYKPIAYCVSKAGILNLTRYLATYWAEKGVRVNTLTLGGVYHRQDERFLAEYNKRTPLGRMANADEYNGAILFLASNASSYMTGSNLIMDGGWTAW